MRTVCSMLVACFALCLSVGPAFSEDKEFSLSVDGRERSWLVHTPNGYDGKKPAPLIIVLHGSGGNGKSIAVDGAIPSRPVPIVIFHGTADEHILYEGGAPKKTIDYRSGTTNRCRSQSNSG